MTAQAKIALSASPLLAFFQDLLSAMLLNLLSRVGCVARRFLTCLISETMKKPEIRKLSKEDLIRLMELPNHLRETMLAVIALGEATATEVSEQTGKARASESDYLNQLERMGYLKRRYSGRYVYFSLAS